MYYLHPAILAIFASLDVDCSSSSCAFLNKRLETHTGSISTRTRLSRDHAGHPRWDGSSIFSLEIRSPSTWTILEYQGVYNAHSCTLKQLSALPNNRTMYPTIKGLFLVLCEFMTFSATMYPARQEKLSKCMSKPTCTKRDFAEITEHVPQYCGTNHFNKQLQWERE